MSWKKDLFEQVDNLLNEKIIILLNEYLDLKTTKPGQVLNNKLALLIEIWTNSLNDQLDFSYLSIINNRSSLTPLFIRKNHDIFNEFLNELFIEIEGLRNNIDCIDLVKIFDNFLTNLSCKTLINRNKKTKTIKLVFSQLNINNERMDSQVIETNALVKEIAEKIIEISAWALFAQKKLQ